MKKNKKQMEAVEAPFMDKKTLDKLKEKALPYVRIYPSLDIIETAEGVFTKTYMIQDMDYRKAKEMEVVEFFLKYSKVLNGLGEQFDIELTIFNKNEPINKNTKAKYLIADAQEHKELTDEYNTFITSLLDKRTVNTIKEKYLTLSVEAEVVDDAAVKFTEAEKILKNLINNIADASIGIVSNYRRIELLYDIYNPGNEHLFKEKVEGTNKLEYDKVHKKNIKIKDIIFPSLFNVCDSFIELDKQFCRSLYLSDIPSSLSENIVSDITNINIPMVTSVHFKALDPSNALKNLLADKERMKYELRLAREKEAGKKGNKKLFASTPKGNKIYKKQEEEDEIEIAVSNPMIDTIEEELRTAIKNKEKMFFVNMSLTHYNETLKGLDNDTDIIQSFLHKILCKMDKCVYNQQDGFVTTLPLGVNRLKSDRVFNSLDAAYFTPFNPQDILRKNGLCYGTNTINKDLVIINRKNSKNPSGFILGASNASADRETEVKREMLLNHIAFKEKVVMITSHNHYDEFFKTMNGEIIEDLNSNVLRTHNSYSGTDEPGALKYKHLTALLTALNKGALTNEEKILIKDVIVFMKENDYKVCAADVIENFTDEKYAFIVNLLEKLPSKYLGASTDIPSNNDMILYKSNGSLEDTLVIMDYIWNEMLTFCSKRERTWIYIDDVEKFFNYVSVASYFKQMFYGCNLFETVVTATTENTHILINNAKESATALSLLQNAGFVKLLGLGVLDRDILQKYLNITSIYVPFISSCKPGEGIIITPECVFGFQENFTPSTSFYKLIHK